MARKWRHFKTRVASRGAHVLGFAAHAVRDGPENALHHGQVLAVVVRLEERDAQIQLEQNAADRPHVARLVPAQFENHLRRPIVARGHDRRVVLVVEGGRAEIDQLDLG